MKRTNPIDVKYRDIARMLAKALPVEDEEFGTKVEEYRQVVVAMSAEQKTALKMAYIWSAKVPREEREDFFQDLALTLLKANLHEEKLAYAIARCDWLDWWRKFKIRQHTSLEAIIQTDDTGNPMTLAETLVGEVEFETRQCAKMDAERIWNKLPAEIKPIIAKRLSGKALTNSDRGLLFRFVKKQGTSLLLASGRRSAGSPWSDKEVSMKPHDPHPEGQPEE